MPAVPIGGERARTWRISISIIILHMIYDNFSRSNLDELLDKQ